MSHEAVDLLFAIALLHYLGSSGSSARRSQKSRQPLDQSVGFRGAALPHLHHLPSAPPQSGDVAPVPFDIALQLWFPVGGPGLRNPPIGAALVLVPEAAMHKNYFLSRRKNNVGDSGEIAPVQAVAVA